jgi:hypothetical protein
MPNHVLMSDLRTRAQQLADMEGDPSISNTEWNGLLSEAYGELYEDTAGTGLRYFEYVLTYTTDGTGYLVEPTDQLSIIDRLELVVDVATGRCRRLRAIAPQEREQWAGRTGSPLAYELVDDRYYLYPTPPSGQKITLRYIPQCPDLTSFADVDVVDCVTAYGRRFLQLAAAIAAMSKSRRDATDLIQERELCRKRHIEWASDRAFNDQPVWFTEDGFGDCDGIPSTWDW